MEICDLSDFDDWPLKKETTDIWEELDTIVSTFETSKFLDRGTCKDRVDVKQLAFPKPVSPDCNKISASAWNPQPQKPSYHQPQQHESTTFTRPFCRLDQTGGRRAVPEAWPAARVVPRKPEHDYSQQLPLSQQALGVRGGSQGRIGIIDLCCDNFDVNDGPSGQKAGKMGAPWRHVKTFTGAVGQQFAYVDGSVKIRDGCALDRLSAGGDGGLWSASSSSSSCKFLRPTFIQAPKTLDNAYSERAKKGHVYWYIEEKSRLCPGTGNTGLRAGRRRCR